MKDRKLARCINRHNAMIDELKEQGFKKCPIADDIDNELRENLIHYYTEMIGYRVIDNMIDFSKLMFNLPIEI